MKDRIEVGMTSSQRPQVIEVSLGDLFGTFGQFALAETFEESRQILEKHPELLYAEADGTLAALIESFLSSPQSGEGQLHETTVALARGHLELLRRSRSVGWENAVARCRNEL
jgi:hypothetical protein